MTFAPITNAPDRPGSAHGADPELWDLDPDDLEGEVARRGLDERSDDALVDAAAEVIGVPRAERADSFGLHAGLELLARRALLALARPADRGPIRTRMLAVAATSAAAGDPAPPVPMADHDGVADALAALVAAVAAGELDDVDASSAWLVRHAEADDLVALVDPLATHLGAAGHGPILLQLLARAAPRSRPALGLARPLAHELARDPAMQLRWVDEVALDGDGDPWGLVEALRAVPRMGVPGSTFVFPLMHQVDAAGVAAAAVAPHVGPATEVRATGRALARLAAWSMLGDDPAAAPYGWTHALTMPQALIDLAPRAADPVRAVAVAASHVAGYRAGLSSTDVGPWSVPAPRPVRADRAIGAVTEAVAGSPREAAATVLGVPEAALGGVVALLAGCAGAHADAHVAKYVLASIDAGAVDPDERRTYLAAAASLLAWWAGPGAVATG